MKRIEQRREDGTEENGREEKKLTEVEAEAESEERRRLSLDD